MSVAGGAAQQLLGRLCDDLRLLREEAGGPSLRVLAAEVGLGKSQLGAILNGRVERLPDWRVVRAVAARCHAYAGQHGRSASLSARFGVEEYWRRRHAAIEQLLSESPVARDLPAPEQDRPRGLPPRGPHFVGRGPELAALTAADGTVIVTGPPGIGKTSLAVHWAHRAADRFPDGQLYVDLRGFEPSGAVLTPAEATRGFLEALGVAPDRLPASPDAQLALYRSLLADRRMLVVLDNARDAEQVLSLLPSGPGCQAVVTSRSRLAGLVVAQAAQVLHLDPLSAGESAELLAARVGEPRVQAERAAAEAIVQACARLPLALSVAACRVALQPALSLAELVRELREEPGELEALRTGDGSTDVRAVFSWSYRTLDAAAARTLRLLGLTSGGDLAPAAAASLAALPVGTARRVLAELSDAGLLSEHRPGRYAMHDLVRAYARELAHDVDSPADRTQATRRLLDHYLHTAHRAAALLHPLFSDIAPAPSSDGATAVELGDAQAAQAWFDAEHAVLLAEIGRACGTGFGRHAWQLVWTLSGYLDRRAMWVRWHEIQELVLQAAERDGDLPGQAHGHRDLARVCSRLGRHDESHGQLKQALDDFADLGDNDGLAQTHLNLGQTLERAHRHREALEHSRRALELFTASGNTAGEAYTLNAVGWQLGLLGDHRQAVAYCRRALERLQRLADPQGVADTLDSLGYAHHHLGDLPAAVACYERALAMFRADGDRFGAAATLRNLAESRLAAGDRDAARAALQEAWEILDRIGHESAHAVRARLDAA
ncbi:ATP-binding protein [Catellatospora vulcania]|uniref:ATP-binding protein n=1 Tax=Catellatospora vulcania TaxID=1460450 RepID=UPI0012D40AF1|nr:tetratricopeptide repeat protein [Catellatospora vulcania]